jgi:hypothetical protein
MNIIFGRHNADLLRDRYLVLDLETLQADGKPIGCFCAIPWEDLTSLNIAAVRHYAHLHQRLIDNLSKKDYLVCQALIEHLTGKFGGQLDTFYETILERINSEV